jgi:hypothetical protein
LLPADVPACSHMIGGVDEERHDSLGAIVA